MSTPAPATTNWVPLWNLNGAVDLRYNGAYVPGNSYADGDIVVRDGITYLCVRPTTAAPAVWPMAPGTSAYGTSLPTSPYDGQEAVLVDSISNPTYQWHFRYNGNSTSAYKWEFVGGSPWTGSAADSIAIAAGWNTVAVPAFTAPRAGDYMVQAHAGINNAAASWGAVAPYTTGPVGTSCYFSVVAGMWGGASCVPLPVNAVAAGAQIKVGIYSGSAGATVSPRALGITPVRVS